MAKTILTKEEADRIAATCYLAIWQIGEFSTAKEGFRDLSTRPFEDILALLDYPTDPIFDIEYGACITWQSTEFNDKASEDNTYQNINSLFGDNEEDL